MHQIRDESPLTHEKLILELASKLVSLHELLTLSFCDAFIKYRHLLPPSCLLPPLFDPQHPGQEHLKVSFGPLIESISNNNLETVPKYLVIGSEVTGSRVSSTGTPVDVLFFIPKDRFHAKDFLNYRYHVINIFYLALIKEKLNAGEWECLEEAFLAIRIRGSESKASLRIHVIPDECPFGLSKLALDRNCIRSETVTESNQLPATPLYNHTLIMHLNMVSDSQRANRLLAPLPAARDALRLVKAWLHYQGHGRTRGNLIGFSSHFITCLLLNKIDQIREQDSNMASVVDCMFWIKALLNELINDTELRRWPGTSRYMAESIAKKVRLALSDSQNFPSNFLSRAEWLAGQGLSLNTMLPPLLEYDVVLKYQIKPTIQLMKQLRSNEFFDLLWEALVPRIVDLSINYALVDSLVEVTVSINLDPVHAYALVTHGPLASSSFVEIERFKFIWEGSNSALNSPIKAELRRFKDGAVRWSIVWPASVARHQIIEMITSHVLGLHLYQKQDVPSVWTLNSAFDSILTGIKSEPMSTHALVTNSQVNDQFECMMRILRSLPAGTSTPHPKCSKMLPLSIVRCIPLFKAHYFADPCPGQSNSGLISTRMLVPNYFPVHEVLIECESGHGVLYTPVNHEISDGAMTEREDGTFGPAVTLTWTQEKWSWPVIWSAFIASKTRFLLCLLETIKQEQKKRKRQSADANGTEAKFKFVANLVQSEPEPFLDLQFQIVTDDQSGAGIVFRLYLHVPGTWDTQPPSALMNIIPSPTLIPLHQSRHSKRVSERAILIRALHEQRTIALGPVMRLAKRWASSQFILNIKSTIKNDATHFLIGEEWIEDSVARVIKDESIKINSTARLFVTWLHSIAIMNIHEELSRTSNNDNDMAEKSSKKKKRKVCHDQDSSTLSITLIKMKSLAEKALQLIAGGYSTANPALLVSQLFFYKDIQQFECVLFLHPLLISRSWQHINNLLDTESPSAKQKSYASARLPVLVNFVSKHNKQPIHLSRLSSSSSSSVIKLKKQASEKGINTLLLPGFDPITELLDLLVAEIEEEFPDKRLYFCYDQYGGKMIGITCSEKHSIDWSAIVQTLKRVAGGMLQKIILF